MDAMAWKRSLIDVNTVARFNFFFFLHARFFVSYRLIEKVMTNTLIIL